MLSRTLRIGAWLGCAFSAFSPALLAQTLTVNNDIHRVATLASTTATLTGTAELHVTGAGDPFAGSVINLNSPDAWFFLDNVLPSQVAASYLGRVYLNGVAAVLDTNVRVVQYGHGAVVIPHGPTFAPLTVYADANFAGSSATLGQYTAYNAAGLGSLSNAISSLKLKRGYMATIAVEENGTGVSRNYIAQDGDLEIGSLPAGLDNAIKFVRVFPWRWTTKKGVAGNPGPNLANQWDYNWNISQNSSLDKEYVAIRQTRWWPGLGQDWKARGINTLLGYNEPDSVDQSNIAFGDAVWSWPDLLGTGLRVGSPAPTDGGLGWLNSFMAGAAAENKRVDFVALHYYRCYGNAADPTGAVNQFYNFLKGVYDTHRKPIWITEWNNGANWTTCADPTAAQQQAVVAAMVNMLDNAYFVERHAVYNWVEDVRRVSWDDGSLTAAGVSFRDKVSPLSHRQEMPDSGATGTALYAFENDARDSSGNLHHGLQAGARAFTTGKSGQAINLDGANDYVQVSPRLAAGSDFTFAAWVYWGGGANWQRIFDFGDGADRYLFLTPKTSGGVLRFAIKNGGAEQVISHTSALPLNTWTHVAVTLSGNTGKLFVNGAVVATNTAVTINPVDLGAKYNYLGKSQFPADPLYLGRLDDVRVQGSAMTDAQVATLAGAGLPSPWATADIGAVAASGSATHASGLYTVVGSGADIAGTADEFRYVYQAGSGDGSIVARVASVQNTAVDAKAGVMYRETTAANARFAAVYVTPGVGVGFQRRTATGGSTASTVVAGVTAPRWLRMIRTGNNFAAYYSANGSTWTQVGTTTAITMATAVQLGLCVTSHLDGTLCTATMDSVTATP
jgi:hypothetical protein